VVKQARAEAGIDDGRRGGVAILNPLVQEIAGALMELGGAAHRDLVIAHIAQKRGAYRAPASLASELDAAFCTYCGGAGDLGLLHLPYGPHSRRWALTDQAYGLLRDSMALGQR
jgi:hypothetical protein